MTVEGRGPPRTGSCRSAARCGASLLSPSRPGGAGPPAGSHGLAVPAGTTGAGPRADRGRTRRPPTPPGPCQAILSLVVGSVLVDRQVERQPAQRQRPEELWETERRRRRADELLAAPGRSPRRTCSTTAWGSWCGRCSVAESAIHAGVNRAAGPRHGQPRRRPARRPAPDRTAGVGSGGAHTTAGRGVAATHDEMVDTRRLLHARPELAMKEHRRPPSSVSGSRRSATPSAPGHPDRRGSSMSRAAAPAAPWCCAPTSTRCRSTRR